MHFRDPLQILRYLIGLVSLFSAQTSRALLQGGRMRRLNGSKEAAPSLAGPPFDDQDRLGLLTA